MAESKMEGKIPQGGTAVIKGANVKSQPKKGTVKTGTDLRAGK